MTTEKELLLGLDVGDALVGVAVSRSGTLAEPFKAFPRAAKEAEAEIIKLIKSQGVQLLVCGLPLSDDNKENTQCQKVRAFCDRITKRTGVEIVFVDEYCTSVDAGELLSLAGKRGRKRENRLDAAAAALILQAYLDDPSIKL
jgi:putative Holliday junction resolvase